MALNRKKRKLKILYLSLGMFLTPSLFAIDAAPAAAVPAFMTLPYDSSFMGQGFPVEKIFDPIFDKPLLRANAIKQFRNLVSTTAKNYKINAPQGFYETLGLPQSVLDLMVYYKKTQRLDGLKRSLMNRVFSDLDDIVIPISIDYQEHKYNSYQKQMMSIALRLSDKKAKSAQEVAALQKDYAYNQNLATLALMQASYAARKYLYYFKNDEYVQLCKKAQISAEPVDTPLERNRLKKLPEIRERLSYYMQNIDANPEDMIAADNMTEINKELAINQARAAAFAPSKEPAH